MNAVHFKMIAYASKEYEAAVSLRDYVLRKPLGLKYSKEDLLAERDQLHIIGEKNGEVVATAILANMGENCKMRQVTVKENVANQGIGSKLLVYFEALAKDRGYHSIFCHARATATKFYSKNGYDIEGEPFEEVGIAHVKMRKIIK